LSQRWRLLDPGSVLIQAYDDRAVVYVCASGDTHELSPAASAVVLALQRQPMDSHGLLERLKRDDPESELFRLENLLQELQHLHVIKQAAD